MYGLVHCCELSCSALQSLGRCTVQCGTLAAVHTHLRYYCSSFVKLPAGLEWCIAAERERQSALKHGCGRSHVGRGQPVLICCSLLGLSMGKKKNPAWEINRARKCSAHKPVSEKRVLRRPQILAIFHLVLFDFIKSSIFSVHTGHSVAS